MGKKIYIGDDQIGTGGSGGGIDLQTLDASLKAYTYDKARIDASFAALPGDLGNVVESMNALDASSIVYNASLYDVYHSMLDNINSSITSIRQNGENNSQAIIQLDSSMDDIYAYAADVSSRVGSGGGGGGSTPDLTNYATKSDISTFKPIQYVNLSTYEENVSDGTIDEDTMYVITDLASSDELATLVTVDDLSTYKQNILDDVSTYADTVINNANTSINSIKTTAINAVQSQQTTSVNAVSSQQTTSVNAVNTAKNNANSSINSAKESALDDISTLAAQKIADMPAIVVMSESDYQQIVPNSSTIYFLT